MLKHLMWLFLATALPLSLSAQEYNDSIADEWDRLLELNEVVVVAKRPVLKQDPDKIVYLIQNDPYAKSLNGIEVLDRIPRVSVINDNISVAGKSSVRYILDGHLLESTEEAIMLQLRNLPSGSIEKIELLTTPPAKYAASSNLAFISITTKNETLGTRGNVWGNVALQEKVTYRLGASVSNTTRKIELSADAGWQDINDINQLDRDFIFEDYTRTSKRTTHFNDKNFGLNGLFKYKFNNRLNAGLILNFISDRFKSNLEDITSENGLTFLSTTVSPARPHTAVTATTFADWRIDDTGKSLSLTYNYFNKDTKSQSDATTSSSETSNSIQDFGHNRYAINSVKLDAVLPFAFLKLETGVAFTDISNRTKLQTVNSLNSESPIFNIFNYSENTWALYASVDRQFSQFLYGKVGLRYENSKVSGHQDIDSEDNNYTFGRLLPSVLVSMNAGRIGRFSLSYSMGISRPNFNDLNPFKYYTTTTDYFSGNPDLKPSVSHNAEINYSLNGIYAVLYNSYNHNSIGYVTRFNADGSQYSIPENFIDADKIGLYASYNRSLFSWWNIKVGGEVFYSIAKSNVKDFKIDEDKGWSGKIEANTSWMLNRQKTLIFNVNFTHYFPYRERMVNYEAFSLFGCDLRYSLLDNCLNLTLSVREPFGWNITKSKTFYQDYTLYSRNNVHSHSVSLRISYSFGGNKVNNVYRDSKERESSRTY